MAPLGKYLIGALVCLGSSSCLRLQWTRMEFCAPVDTDALPELVEGVSDLHACLGQFGAPLYVWQIGDEEYALAYGWDEDQGWGFNVSVPVGQEVSASFDFDDLDRRLHGVVLTFDGDHRLLRKRRGYLAEIMVVAGRRRPALVEDEESDSGDDTDEGNDN